jgi:formylmethanofuran dehydrogenase subunit E
MMSKMGMGGKLDMKAMTNKLQENLRKSKMKERMNKKREERAAKTDVNITQKASDTFVVKVDESIPEKSQKSKNHRKKSKKPRQAPKIPESQEPTSQES